MVSVSALVPDEGVSFQVPSHHTFYFRVHVVRALPEAPKSIFSRIVHVISSNPGGLILSEVKAS